MSASNESIAQPRLIRGLLLDTYGWENVNHIIYVLWSRSKLWCKLAFLKTNKHSCSVKEKMGLDERYRKLRGKHIWKKNQKN